MKNILTVSLSIILTTSYSYNANAQQKPSERSLAADMPEIKARQAARNNMLRKYVQTGTTGHSSSAIPMVNNTTVPVGGLPHSTVPVIKASQKPVRIPARHTPSKL